MKEIILCKYGELILKGANKSSFESQLIRELRRRSHHYGNFNIHHAQSAIYIEPLDDFADIDGMYDSAKCVFGIVGISRCAVAEKNMDSICQVIKEYLPSKLRDIHTFKVESKRADKRFPLTSPEISKIAGGAILSSCQPIKVDVHEPDAIIRIEVRENGAYIHTTQEKSAGGLPRGSAGKGLLLLSGGIDSPVAGYMMARRGLEIEAVHFESFPYTSERAREKVFTLAKELCTYTSRINIHVISLTEVQEELARKCDEDYFTLLLRWFMMKLAERCAKAYKCGALVTGESLGQVASQTMQAMQVTGAATTLPVFRPCIGMDKDDIVQIARKIGTFDTSILPFEDCCTVFTPRHPKTQPALDDVLFELGKVDFNTLFENAWNSMKTETITMNEDYKY